MIFDTTFYRLLIFFLIQLASALFGAVSYAQVVPVDNYSLNTNGQVELTVGSSSEKYYVLYVKDTLSQDFKRTASVTLGKEGNTVITESLAAYPLDHYQVRAFSISSPEDIDNDGFNDIVELNNIPVQGPLNAAEPIAFEDGVAVVDSFTTFRKLSLTQDTVQYSEFLNGKGYVKFIIVDFQTDNPKTYFIDSYKYDFHSDFANAIGIPHLGDQVRKGQIIYHPKVVSNNGTLGAFTFNYSNGHGEAFEVVQKCYNILGANMPFIENNLSYFVTANSEDEYEEDQDLYENSRIPILHEEDIYGGIEFLGLNIAEGFGYFKHVTSDKNPGPRDIVLYEYLPNSLPRVGGIMTSVTQTPLSHVNLRAIQNKIPNAYIKGPLEIDSIADLLDHYIYYRVEQDQYYIREATFDEVTAWYDASRPTEEQNPPLNLSYKQILPMDDIGFEMHDGFGAKCANVSVMRGFNFEEGTIPDGFGIPFFFYQEFMKFNDFFTEVETMISDPLFESSREVRDSVLKDFRSKMKDGNMPNWMLTALNEMHLSFPAGTSVRCRSSTNNEDLPGFSGAGLYTSKTQHPDEGHISKSIKQVYASLWNLGAFEEREFYRINHFQASMGVLCHPNYSDELANGVGLSIDPLYNSTNTFFLNTQVGEELITNPSSMSIPEEILIDRVPISEDNYIVIEYSNLAPENTIIMEESQLEQLRDYLLIIHDRFAKLYNASSSDNFAMDIEYKITIDNRLAIKQARPWAAYNPSELSGDGAEDELTFEVYPNPADHIVNVNCVGCFLSKIALYDVSGKLLFSGEAEKQSDFSSTLDVRQLPSGIYFLTGYSSILEKVVSSKIVKR